MNAIRIRAYDNIVYDEHRRSNTTFIFLFFFSDPFRKRFSVRRVLYTTSVTYVLHMYFTRQKVKTHFRFVYTYTYRAVFHKNT